MRGKYSESSAHSASDPTCFNVHGQVLGNERDGDIGSVEENSVTSLGIGNVLIHDDRGVSQDRMILAYVTVENDRLVCGLAGMEYYRLTMTNTKSLATRDTYG